jgi:hypothetical protein
VVELVRIVLSGAGAGELLSVVDVAGSSGAGAVVEGVVVVGSVAVGCACGTSWARSGVEESASAAAIAGRALVGA